LRTICVAYKDLKEHEGGNDHDQMSDDGINRIIERDGLTCVAILGIRDIIRPEVPEAVATCQRAGIKVRMVTGDNLVTAVAIAKECGILPNDFKALNSYEISTGPDFYERVGGISNPGAGDAEVVTNKEEFLKYRDHLKVLARSRPEDKYLLATGLRQFDDVVAVTGDGTNDAPALKKADVGFAMGITGTDVAQHAADIIILDDSFASIVSACKWGRNIYDNIRRFL
jgi:Ca2+ transporting ATPase